MSATANSSPNDCRGTFVTSCLGFRRISCAWFESCGSASSFTSASSTAAALPALAAAPVSTSSTSRRMSSPDVVAAAASTRSVLRLPLLAPLCASTELRSARMTLVYAKEHSQLPGCYQVRTQHSTSCTVTPPPALQAPTIVYCGGRESISQFSH